MRVRPLELVLILTMTAVTVAWALGCGPGLEPVVTDCEDGSPADGQPQVILGTRVDDEFVAFGSNGRLPLNHGAQGGQHIYVSTRLYTAKEGTFRERFLLKNGTQALGEGSATVDGCKRGWTVSHQVTVFVDSATTTAGLLELEVAEVDQGGQPIGPSIRSSAQLQIGL